MYSVKDGEVLNDNPNPHVMKPRTSIDYLFPDTRKQIDEICKNLPQKSKSQVCPHCGKKYNITTGT